MFSDNWLNYECKEVDFQNPPDGIFRYAQDDELAQDDEAA